MLGIKKKCVTLDLEQMSVRSTKPPSHRTGALAIGVAFAGLTIGATMLFLGHSTSALVQTATELGTPAPLTPSPPPPPETKLATGIVAEEANAWRIEMIAPADCRVGASCDVTFRLLPNAGWRANRDYPYKFVASRPGSALTTSGPAFSFATQDMTFSRFHGHVDLVADGTALIHVVIVPHEVGRHRIVGRLKASACTSELCRIGFHDIDVSLTAS